MLPETKTPVTIEAAGYRGRPVLFEIVGPWTPASREPQGRAQSSGNPILVIVLLAAAAVAAYVNVRRGRADRRGAFRLATFTFFMIVSIWVVNPHVNDIADEEQRFFLNVALALFVAGALYLLYLGLEPFVRRSWPTMLVAWSRLLGGRVRDPLIGHDILVGVACGAAFALLNLSATVLSPKLGLPESTPHTTDLGAIVSARAFIGTLLNCLNVGLQNALITVFEFASLRALFEWVSGKSIGWAGRRWAWAGKLAMSDDTSERVFVVLAVVMVTLLSASGHGAARQQLLDVGYQAVSTTLVLLVLLRSGIFGSAIMFFANFLLLRVPLTLDGSALYAPEAWFTIGGILALAAAGLWMARRIPDRSSLIANR